jgi:hypothetical protein
MLRAPEGPLAKQTPAEIKVWMAIDADGREVFETDEYIDGLLEDGDESDTEPIDYLCGNVSTDTAEVLSEMIESGVPQAQIIAVRRLPAVIRSQIMARNGAKILDDDHLDMLRDAWAEALQSNRDEVRRVALDHFNADERMASRDETTYKWLAWLAVPTGSK